MDVDNVREFRRRRPVEPAAELDLDLGELWALEDGDHDVVRVLVLDDRRLSRRGLELVLGAEDDIEVVGAADPDAAVDQVIDLRPDVVLIDGRMSAGPVAYRTVRAAAPQARIMVLDRPRRGRPQTTGAEPTLYGVADGVLRKDLPGDEVADAIRQMARRR